MNCWLNRLIWTPFFGKRSLDSRYQVEYIEHNYIHRVFMKFNLGLKFFAFSLFLCGTLGLLNWPLFAKTSSITAYNAWHHHNPSTPKGQLTSYQFSSRLLKNRREIRIYTPHSYHSTAKPYPLLIVFDGQAYTSQLIPGPTILDNLIGEGKIPPLIAVFVSSMDQSTRNRELPCYDLFGKSLVNELLPWLQNHFHVAAAPSQIILAGSSYGGLAAAYAAHCYPQHFGNVLSQSGAYRWRPSSFSENFWLAKQYESKPPLGIRFYLDVGDQETEKRKGDPSMIEANRHLRDTLVKRGYQVTYHEFCGGHDYDCWKETFASGLIALFQESD